MNINRMVLSNVQFGQWLEQSYSKELDCDHVGAHG